MGDQAVWLVLSIIQSVVTNPGNKAITMLVSSLSVPLTIASVLACLALTDFGLGNGLTNAVTTAAGEDRSDLAQMHLSDGLFLLTSIA